MVSGTKIAAFMVAIAIGAMLFTPVTNAVNDNAGSVDVENESVTAELDTYVGLEGYNIEDGSETVRWYNETSDSYETLTEGTDYEIRGGEGSLNVMSDSPAGGGDEILVSYTYEATNTTQTTVLTLIPLLFAVLLLGMAAFKATEMM